MKSLSGARALFVLGTLEIGGTERQALLLARYLKEERSVEVRVLGVGRKPGRLASLCEESGIPWRCLPLPWPEGRLGKLKDLVSLARGLRRERPDVILAFNWLPNVACGLTWRVSGARLGVWNQRDGGCGLNAGLMQRTAVRWSSGFMSNSVHARRFLSETYGLRPGKIAVIPNAIALPRLAGKGSRRELLGIGGEAFVACMVANLHQLKDHTTILRAWKTVCDLSRAEGVSPLLLLAGRDDGEGMRLKAEAFDLELGDAVRFLGFVDDVAGLYAAADLCVHGTKTEGCPNAVLEAMATGLPVAASDVPGVREAVGPEGYRFLCPPGDASALAERILELLRAPRLRAEAGAAMRRRVETEHDPRAVCAKAAAYVEELLAEADAS